MGCARALAATVPANVSSLPRSGPLIVNWISAFWFPPPPNVATGLTPVRRFAGANGGITPVRTASITANWSRVRASSDFSFT